jgi:hypothetical protein
MLCNNVADIGECNVAGAFGAMLVRQRNPGDSPCMHASCLKSVVDTRGSVVLARTFDAHYVQSCPGHGYGMTHVTSAAGQHKKSIR